MNGYQRVRYFKVCTFYVEKSQFWEEIHVAVRVLNIFNIIFQLSRKGHLSILASYTPPPLKNLKHIGFLSNNGPDPLRNQKSQSYQASIQCRVIIGPPVKRHLNGFLCYCAVETIELSIRHTCTTMPSTAVQL